MKEYDDIRVKILIIMKASKQTLLRKILVNIFIYEYIFTIINILFHLIVIILFYSQHYFDFFKKFIYLCYFKWHYVALINIF